MNVRSNGLVFLPLAAILAIAFSFTKSGTQAPALLEHSAASKPAASPTPPATKSTAPPRQEKGVELLSRFWGDNWNDPAASARRQKPELSFLVATIPDPQESSLKYLFDRNLDAIQNALGASGYRLDRYALPWDYSGESEKMARAPQYKQTPGVILFRKTNGAAQPGQGSTLSLLLLFLVGETPTAGIHKEAFRNALSQIDQLAGDAPPPIRILGPTFSGSAQSMKFGLAQWVEARKPAARQPNPRINIVSGSATAIDQTDFVQQLKSVYPPGAVSFSATVLPDPAIVKSLVSFLGGEAALKETLFLTENTTYGQNALGKGKDIATFTFPLHISHLRREMLKSKPAVEATAAETPLGRELNLPMSLTDPETTLDVLPPFSMLETNTNELILSAMFTEINRRQYRYVGIMATDLRDRIFLLSELRRHCPNITPISFSGDILYLHMDFNADLRGLLLLTPYPIVAPNRAPQTSAAGFQLLPSETAYGVFNATLALVNGTPLSLCAAEAAPSRNALSPSLWLSIVGRDDLYPIAMLPVEDQSAIAYACPAGMTAGPAAAHWPSAFLNLKTLSLLGLALAALIPLLFTVTRTVSPLEYDEKAEAGDDERKPWWGSLWMDMTFSGIANRHRVLEEELADREVVLVGTHLLLCAIAALVTIPLWPQIRHGKPLFTALIGVQLLLLLLSLWRRRRLIRPLLTWKNDRSGDVRAHWGRRIYGYFYVCGFPMIAIGLMGGYIASIYGLDPTVARFLSVRTTHLLSGVSPLLPLILIGAAGFFWLLCALRRQRLLEFIYFRRNPETPAYLDLGVASFAEASGIEKDVRRLLVRRDFELPCWVLVSALLIGSTIYIFYLRGTPSVEGASYDRLFGFCFFMIYQALSLSFLRFVFLWKALRRLTRYLSLHPLSLRLNKKLRQVCPEFPEIQPATHLEPLRLLSFAVQQARRVQRLADRAPEKASPQTPEDASKTRVLQELVKQAEESDAQVRRAVARSAWRTTVGSQAGLQEILLEIGQIFAAELEHAPEAPPPPARSETADVPPDDYGSQAAVYLVALFSIFVNNLLDQMRNLAVFVTSGLVLMLAAGASYPFQPQGVLLVFNWVIVLLVVLATTGVFLQMNRDHFLCLIAGTAGGEVTWNKDLVAHLFYHGVIPILALLSVQFSQTMQQIASWLNLGSQ